MKNLDCINTKSTKTPPKKQVNLFRDDSLLNFDSGKYITFADACHHTLVCGTTGCGKTMGTILPGLYSCIMSGYGGFIVDCKNNMTEKVKAIAKQCGREGDIIELGSEATALPINIMQGMDCHEIYNYLQALMLNIVNRTDHNKSWHEKGLHVAIDMAEMLLYMEKLDTRFTPSITNIYQFMNDFVVSSKLFAQFVEVRRLFVDKKTPLFKIDNFIKSVKSRRFHVVNNDVGRRGYTSDRFDEQTTWAFEAIRNALRSFLQTPGFACNFASAEAKQFSMEEALLQSKIVVLRFSPATGPMGASLARYLTERFYRAVYATGLDMPKNQYSFVVLDEFQQFADLTDARFSDGSFVAQAREFRCIFMAATQSLSALLTERNTRNRVNQFVSNCNNRILFYSDDDLLQDMAQKYDQEIKLNKLENEVFVINFDSQKRKHLYSLEKLQNAHETMCHMLKGVSESKKFRLDIDDNIVPISRYPAWFRKIIEQIQADAKSRKAPCHALCKEIEF